MPIDVAIRPGAALDDPDTYRFVESDIINKEYGPVVRRSWLPDRAYNPQGIVNVLANYPWYEYGFKAGRWFRQPIHYILPSRWRAWETFTSSILLVHTATGQEVGELSGLAFGPPRPVTLERAGRLAFAGDPQVAGVISVITKSGERHMSIVASTRLLRVDSPSAIPVFISARARDLAKAMTPEQPPAVEYAEPRPDYLKNLGPWLADHPDKPPKPGR